MTDKPTALSLLAPARSTREEVDEFAPTLIYSPESGEPGAIGLLKGESPVPQMLFSALGQLHKHFGHAEWIALTADTHALSMPKEEKKKYNRKLKKGEKRLAEEFAEGNPNVVEMMLVIVADKDGIQSASQIYRHTPVEGWEWDEPKESEKADEGVIPALIKSFFAAQEITKEMEEGNESS